MTYIDSQEALEQATMLTRWNALSYSRRFNVLKQPVLCPPF